jgi:hypothetical protein
VRTTGKEPELLEPIPYESMAQWILKKKTLDYEKTNNKNKL